MSMLKFWIALAIAVLSAILPGLDVIGDGFGLVEVINVTVLAAGALQVLVAPNIPSFRYVKVAAFAISAGGVVFISVYSDGVLTLSEGVQIALAVLGTVGVGAARNTGTVDGVFTSGRHALPA